MKLLVSLKAKDVDKLASNLDYDSFKTRDAVRAIVLNYENKIALIHVSKHDYYMLPGGGVEEGEDFRKGLKRELAEELGTAIKIIDEVGSSEVYFDRWSKKQVDYCYIARVIEGGSNKNLTNFEIEEGHNAMWVDGVQSAIKLVSEANPINTEGKLVRERDLVFLEAALATIMQLS